MPGAGTAALSDDLLGDGGGRADNEFLFADGKAVRGRGIERRRPTRQIDARIELDEFAERLASLGHFVCVIQHDHLAANAKVVLADLAPGLVGFVPIGVENLDHLVLRMERRGDFGAAPRCLARRGHADDRHPFRRVRLLNGRGARRRLSKFQIFAVMRDDRLCQRLVDDLNRLIVAGARLVHAEPDLRHFLRNPRGGPDLEAAAGQMVQHADLFDQLPWRMIGQHHAQNAKPDFFGAQRDIWAISRLGEGRRLAPK